MSSALHRIAAVVRLALAAFTGFIVFPENYTRSLAKGLTVRVTAGARCITLSVARNLDIVSRAGFIHIPAEPDAFHFHYIFVT